MKRIWRFSGLIIGAVFALPTLVAAQVPAQQGTDRPAETPLNAQQLKGTTLLETLNGQTFDLLYRTPHGFIGKQHHTETHKRDGTTLYIEGDIRTTGLWWLSGAPGFEDTLCYRYPELQPGRNHCFGVFKDGTCLYFYSARTVINGRPINMAYWGTKGVNRTMISTCDEQIA